MPRLFTVIVVLNFVPLLEPWLG